MGQLCFATHRSRRAAKRAVYARLATPAPISDNSEYGDRVAYVRIL